MEKTKCNGIVIPDKLAVEYLGYTKEFMQKNDIVAFAIPKEFAVSETSEELNVEAHIDSYGNLHIEENILEE